jgi:flagellar hook-length control protein FliK
MAQAVIAPATIAPAAPIPATDTPAASATTARAMAAQSSLVEAIVARVGGRGHAASDGASADTSRDAQAFVSSVIGPQAAAASSGAELSAVTTAPAPAASTAAATLATPVLMQAVQAPTVVDTQSVTARFEQTLARLDPDVRNLQAMVRTVRLFTSGTGVSEARLQLEPDHLGPVSLTVRMEQGTVSAHFRTETPAAQRWIETHQNELRSGLREQGLEVKDLVVTTDPDGRRERRQEAPPARPTRTRRSAPDADAPRFEVLV